MNQSFYVNKMASQWHSYCNYSDSTFSAGMEATLGHVLRSLLKYTQREGQWGGISLTGQTWESRCAWGMGGAWLQLASECSQSTSTWFMLWADPRRRPFLPTGSRGGSCGPQPLGMFPRNSDSSNRDFATEKLHPGSPPWNLDQRKDSPWGFVSFEMCSSPIHIVSLWLSRSCSAFCSKQVFLHISTLWT